MTDAIDKRIGIIAALPGELAPLVRGWTSVTAAKNIHRYERDVVRKDGRTIRWIALCAGIGCAAATRAFSAAEDAPLNAVISIGWAGALTRAALPGTALAADWIINAQTGERFEMASHCTATADPPIRRGLITTSRVAEGKEKLRLATFYPGAQLVDMEAATVARLATMRGIPAYCFKGVSDGFEDQLPDLNPFIDSHGQFQTARFIASVAIKPQHWSALRAFGANSKAAAEALASAVKLFLDQYD
ncbi:MAG TPA: nucleoside phosphorylase [Acidisarcina sp.]